MIKKDYQVGDKVEIVLNYFEMYKNTHNQKKRQYFGTVVKIIDRNENESLYEISGIPNLNFYDFDLKPIE